MICAGSVATRSRVVEQQGAKRRPERTPEAPLITTPVPQTPSRQ